MHRRVRPGDAPEHPPAYGAMDSAAAKIMSTTVGRDVRIDDLEVVDPLELDVLGLEAGLAEPVRARFAGFGGCRRQVLRAAHEQEAQFGVDRVVDGEVEAGEADRSVGNAGLISEAARGLRFRVGGRLEGETAPERVAGKHEPIRIATELSGPRAGDANRTPDVAQAVVGRVARCFASVRRQEHDRAALRERGRQRLEIPPVLERSGPSRQQHDRRQRFAVLRREDVERHGTVTRGAWQRLGVRDVGLGSQPGNELFGECPRGRRRSRRRLRRRGG